MPRGPIYSDDYRPQFSGHETFPLRYGWLKKAYDAVYEREDGPDGKLAFTRDDSIARYYRRWRGCQCACNDKSRPTAIRKKRT